MIIVNGINSEIFKKILPKFLKNDKVVGIFNTSYTGPKNKIFFFKKNKINFNKIEKLIKNEKKISFLNFATKRDEKLLINKKKGELKNIFENNLVEPIELLKKFIPYMIKNKFGRIIFVSSSTAENGYPGILVTVLVNLLLWALWVQSAKNIKNFNITCNVISLGYFETKMWKSLSAKNRSTLINNTLSQKYVIHWLFMK